jgi:hypothetical protein
MAVILIILRLCFASIFLWLFFRASLYYAKFNIEDSTGSDCGGQAHDSFSWESVRASRGSLDLSHIP